MTEGGIGKATRRVEDLNLICGNGRYTDDLSLEYPKALSLFVVRSPYAAARIVSIDADEALHSPGVLAVLTAEDLAAEALQPIPTRVQRKRANGEPHAAPPYFPLAAGRVRHVGEAVAAIIAETLEQAKDAADLIGIDYEMLPSVTDTVAAADPSSPRVWDQYPDNFCFEFKVGDPSSADRKFEEAAHVVTERFVISRIATNALEPRAALASFDSRTGRYTLTAGVQSPHMIRQELATIFNLPPTRFRVVAPDVGGAFGMKGSLHPELILVLFASRLLGRPVKHVADRSESFLSDHQSRDNVSDVSLALDEHGKFLGLRVETVANIGAYVASNGLHSPTNNLGGLAGVYTTPAFDVTVRGVLSNTVPTCPYRGAGRPEASYCIEQIIDKAARQLGIDRAEIRRRNMIPQSAMPYQTPLVFTYDCGEFEAVMDECLAAADWVGFETRRREAGDRGLLRGIGLACVIEVAGGPHDRPFEEGAEIRFDATGNLTILAGSHSQGQGHATAYLQFAAEFLGIPADNVHIVFGDTDVVPHGRGTFGSRTMMAFGNAFFHSCGKIIDKGKVVAAHILEASPSDLDFENGRFSVAGTDRSISLREVAAASFDPRKMPTDMELGLQAASIVALKKPTFPNGCHVCEIEIDPETGDREIVAYHVVDDVGTIVNPLLLKGQIQGGVVQGAGQILGECIAYDSYGQILTGSFLDYGMPRAMDLPPINVISHPVPTATNPLGVKGAGEAGTVGALPAVMSAVMDALAPLGVKHIDMPATPMHIWQAIRSTEK